MIYLLIMRILIFNHTHINFNRLQVPKWFQVIQEEWNQCDQACAIIGDLPFRENVATHIRLNRSQVSPVALVIASISSASKTLYHKISNIKRTKSPN